MQINPISKGITHFAKDTLTINRLFPLEVFSILDENTESIVKHRKKAFSGLPYNI